jgi:hypothetical protein
MSNKTRNEEVGTFTDDSVTDIGSNSRRYSEADLRDIKSFDDAMALAAQTLGAESIVDASDVLGNGFTILQKSDKDRLIGMPFIILSYDFHIGDFGTTEDGGNGYYVSIMLVTKDGGRYILNDGGTGIYAQLDEHNGRSQTPGGLVVNGGLRKSEYEYTDEATGKKSAAATFYLNV